MLLSTAYHAGFCLFIFIKMQILYFQCYGSSLLFLLSLTGKTTQLLDAIQVACAGHDLSDRTRMFFTKGNSEDPSKPEKGML